MKAKDLHERTVEDLKELEKTLSKDLFDSRFKNFTNRLDNTASLRTARREIARIKTVLAQKSKGAAPATQKSPVLSPQAGAPGAAEEKPIPKAAASKPAKKAAAPAEKPSKPAAKKTTKKTEKKA
jgi:large subunit ribosomal protein L29